jgi:hypothetical protein
LLYEGAREADVMLVPLKRFESEVMVVCSDCIMSSVVRFRLVFSSGVVGSSPLF